MAPFIQVMNFMQVSADGVFSFPRWEFGQNFVLSVESTIEWRKGGLGEIKKRS
jgi:hypothetical protein